VALNIKIIKIYISKHGEMNFYDPGTCSMRGDEYPEFNTQNRQIMSFRRFQFLNYPKLVVTLKSFVP